MSCDSIIVPANNFINPDCHLLTTVYFLPEVLFMTGIIFIIVYLPGIFVNTKTMFYGHPLKNCDRCNITKKPCSQLLVSCGGGRRLADGLRKQHVRTIRLPVWDTLEDFSP